MLGSMGGAMVTLTLGFLTTHSWMFILSALIAGGLIGFLLLALPSRLRAIPLKKVVAGLVAGVLLGGAGVVLGDLHGLRGLMIVNVALGACLGIWMWQLSSRVTVATEG